MLKSLTLKNFQPHKKRVVEFDKYVTTIIGDNDRGKTSILRGLLWLCFNRPTGIKFIRRGRKSCEVALTVDGHTITHSRGKGNLYTLDGKTFAAVRSDVPDDVQAVLRMCEENFQLQLSSPFWFLNSGGQVAKELNQIVNLESIDSSQAAIAARLRTARASRGEALQRLAGAKAARKRLAWVAPATASLAAIDALGATIDAKGASLARLVDLTAKATEYRTAKANAKTALVGARSIVPIEKRVDRLAGQVSSLAELINNYESMEEERCKTETSLKQVKRKLAKVKVCPTCKRPL